jgi:hypothetical protein
MIDSKNFLTILYTLMAICHFLLGVINLDNGVILVTQILGAIFWAYMACNSLDNERA